MRRNHFQRTGTAPGDGSGQTPRPLLRQATANSSDGGVVLLREADRHLGGSCQPGTARPTGFRQGGALPAEPVAPAGLCIPVWVTRYWAANTGTGAQDPSGFRLAGIPSEVAGQPGHTCAVEHRTWPLRQRQPEGHASDCADTDQFASLGDTRNQTLNNVEFSLRCHRLPVARSQGVLFLRHGVFTPGY